jgi:plastocyanin
VKRFAYLLLCVACNSAPRTQEVAIRDYRFEPGTLSVYVGDTVRWHNYDFVPHTATATGVFDSGDIAPNASWSTAATAGTHDYICTLHPNMKGTLIVR